MPKKRRKRVSDLPTNEAIRKIFPRKVVEEAKRVAHEKHEERNIRDTDSMPGEP